MSTTDNLQPERFFHGTMSPHDIVPAEDAAPRRDRRGAGRAYHQSLRDDIAAYGMLTPVTLDYAKRGSGRSPRPYIVQGHHRHTAALELQTPEIPVSAASAYGPPKGMKNAHEITLEEFSTHINGYAWGRDQLIPRSPASRAYRRLHNSTEGHAPGGAGMPCAHRTGSARTTAAARPATSSSKDTRGRAGAATTPSTPPPPAPPGRCRRGEREQ